MTIRNIVLWSAADDELFAARYRDEHLALVRALPGLETALASPLRSRSHSILAELTFTDLDAMKSSFASEEGRALIAHTAQLEAEFGVKATSLVVLEPYA